MSPDVPQIAPPRIRDGRVHAFFAFDVSSAIELEAIPRAFRPERTRILRRRPAPEYVEYAVPPVDVACGECRLELPGGVAQVAASARLFDFGAVSVSFSLRLPEELEALPKFAQALPQDALVAEARRILEELVREIGPALRGFGSNDLVEDYFVFHLAVEDRRVLSRRSWSRESRARRDPGRDRGPHQSSGHVASCGPRVPGLGAASAPSCRERGTALAPEQATEVFMRRRRSKSHPAALRPRPARRVHDESHDPFATPGKHAEPAVCPRCGAVLRAGRWIWGSAPAEAAPPVECPACLRIAQHQPDGILIAAGDFVVSHRDEILSLLRHVEENETREHALARTFGIGDEAAGLVVRTTERRLAESIGRALERAYGGRLERVEGDRATPLRVHWQRD
jgi:hypothetical protein